MGTPTSIEALYGARIDDKPRSASPDFALKRRNTLALFRRSSLSQ